MRLATQHRVPSARTHQTVRLVRGKHFVPSEGVCVMELASMLAGERFSDHPFSVCPVIAAFARAYNDACGPEQRQMLYDWASRAVGSRAGADVELAREQLLYMVAVTLRTRLPILRWRQNVKWCAPPEPPLRELKRDELAAHLSVRLARRSDGHAIAVALFDALLALGAGDWSDHGRWFGSVRDPGYGTTGSFS